MTRKHCFLKQFGFSFCTSKNIELGQKILDATKINFELADGLDIRFELNEDASTNNIFPERSRTFSVSELLFCFSCLFCLFVYTYTPASFLTSGLISINTMPLPRHLVVKFPTLQRSKWSETWTKKRT